MLRNRPAAFLCLIFTAGMAAGLFLKYQLVFVFAAALAVCFIFKPYLKKRFLIVTLSCAALLCGYAYSTVFTAITRPPTPENGTVYNFDAAVKSLALYDGDTRLELVVKDKSSAFDGKTVYMYTSDSKVSPCDTIRLNARLVPSSIKGKSSGADYMAYGSYSVCDEQKPPGLDFAVVKLRQTIGDAIERCFEGEAAHFYRAVITGDRSKVGTEINASFSRSGILHILAVSGQHFSLIIVGLYRLLMHIFKRKRACSIVAIVAAVLYTVFTGFSPSVLRAAFMCCAVFCANIFKERSDSLITLSLALVILLLFNPYAIVNTGLQLSFLATLGIILTLDRLDRLYEEKKIKAVFKPLITSTALSVAASLFCMPVYLFGFDYVSICSPITNLFANFLVGPAMLCGIVAVPLKAVFIDFASQLGELIFELLLFISDSLAYLKFSCMSLHTPFIWLLLVPSVVTAVIYMATYFKKGLTVLVTSALCSVLICFCCYGVLLLDYSGKPLLYVRESTSSLCVLYSDGKSFTAIDGGGEGNVSGYIAENGCVYLDNYVITDCNNSALQRLCATLPYLPAKTVYIPEGESEAAKQIISYCKNKGFDVCVYNPRSGLALGDINIYGSDMDETENSLLIKSKDFALFGKGAGLSKGVWEDCKALIITRACTESPCNPDLLPLNCDKAFIFKNDKSFFTEHINTLQISKDVNTYGNTLVYRVE